MTEEERRHFERTREVIIEQQAARILEQEAELAEYREMMGEADNIGFGFHIGTVRAVVNREREKTGEWCALLSYRAVGRYYPTPLAAYKALKEATR